MAEAWKIRKKQEACARCEREFEEGESHFSLLLVEPESLGREDRCTPCFEASDAVPELVFWRTRRRPEGKRGLAVDFESVLMLFLALEGRAEPRLGELRYLLALLLMRKKRLKLVRVKRASEGKPERMVVRRPRREEALEVPVHDLTPERMDELRAELERIFEGAGAEDLLVPAAGGLEPGEASGGAPGAAGAADAEGPDPAG